MTTETEKALLEKISILESNQVKCMQCIERFQNVIDRQNIQLTDHAQQITLITSHLHGVASAVNRKLTADKEQG